MNNTDKDTEQLAAGRQLHPRHETASSKDLSRETMEIAAAPFNSNKNCSNSSPTNKGPPIFDFKK